MAAVKPRFSNYGNSFADKTFGTKILSQTTKGEIITSSLNDGTLADTVEFNNFETTVKDYILARLGYPVVRVELTSFQIKTCIDESITKLSYHSPMWANQFCCFIADAGKNLYELPQYILNNLDYVVYKKSLLSMQYQAGSLEFDFFIKYFQDNFLFSDFAVSDFNIMQTYLETIRKVLSQEGSWDVINNQYLQIYPTPVMDQAVIVQYRALDSATIHPYYHNWIQKYALACAKGVLGAIRGKYKSLPSPGGGAMLDGEALKLESKEEKAALYEDLLREIEEPPVFTTY